MASASIKVLCADDSMDISTLLRMSIAAEPDLECVGCVHEVDSIIDEVGRTGPDVLIIDLSMPGRNSLDVVRELSQRHPATRAIIYSGYDDTRSMDLAIDAGAWGYVSKHGDLSILLEAVRRVAAGEVSLTRG